MFETACRINAPDVVSEEFDGEFVVLDLTNGCYFSFRDSGNRLWSALMGGVVPQAMLDALAAAGNPHLEAVRAFLAQLIGQGLVVADPALAPAAVPQGLRTLDSAPAIERYDDLAELILADPIHEADAEHGWPVRPKAAG